MPFFARRLFHEITIADGSAAGACRTGPCRRTAQSGGDAGERLLHQWLRPPLHQRTLSFPDRYTANAGQRHHARAASSDAAGRYQRAMARRLFLRPKHIHAARYFRQHAALERSALCGLALWRGPTLSRQRRHARPRRSNAGCGRARLSRRRSADLMAYTGNSGDLASQWLALSVARRTGIGAFRTAHLAGSFERRPA